MSDQDYHLDNINKLLQHGFSECELWRLTTDETQFFGLTDSLADRASKEEIIAEIIIYVRQKLAFEELLTWAKRHNE